MLMATLGAPNSRYDIGCKMDGIWLRQTPNPSHLKRSTPAVCRGRLKCLGIQQGRVGVLMDVLLSEFLRCVILMRKNDRVHDLTYQ